MRDPTTRPRRRPAAARILLILLALVATGTPATTAATAQSTVDTAGVSTDPGSYVTTHPGPGRFPLVAAGRAATLVVSTADHPGVTRVVGDLQADLERVTGVRPAVSLDRVPRGADVVLIGTVGHSPLIDGLVAAGRLDVRSLAGKWETSIQQVVSNPLPGIRRALVLAGSDQRGTIYAAYDVSRGIGVSPWYFWDDVRPTHRDALYVMPGRHTQGTPAVRYRGFFINDENPALGRWVPRFFGPGKAPGFPGAFNAAFYAKIFETMLRLKANYLWPAVWGRAFAEDDPANHATATAYGVVMGTSHEAPMMRGIEEWNRHAVAAVRDANGTIVTPGRDPYGGTGEWSFRRNRPAIEAYWRDGIRRMVQQGFEGVVTLGMRGNGDVGLPDGDGIELMQEIIATQRRILAEETGRDPATIPQVWSLYKEVQRYWDKGLRVPDDVTVVFTDDNWGNLRKLPPRTEQRPGGYGLYYHFDYVGGGRNYKWVDTANLANLWDQLHQASAYGTSGLWVANAGDLKSNELPTQFFLDYAWNPARWPIERLGEWERRYAAENFGPGPAAAIAEVLHEYGQLQGRRKPELLNRKITADPTQPAGIRYDDQATPFSLTAYDELDRVTADWQRLAARAERIGRALPAAAQDTYYQLVSYAVIATANLYELRQAEFTNLRYAAEGRAATNRLAGVTEARFATDLALAERYNTGIAGGKWAGFQTQPHIDYGDIARYGPNAPWQQPELRDDAIPDVIFPAVRRIELPAAAELGVGIDGAEGWWPATTTPAVLPALSPYSTGPAPYVEVFNRGSTPFRYRIRSAVPWLTASAPSGIVAEQVRARLEVDWRRAPRGTTSVPVTITGAGRTVVVQAVIDNPAVPRLRGFVEAGGYVSIDAGHARRVVGDAGVSWLRIPDIGRTGSGMEAWSSTGEPATGARLEYEISLLAPGPVTVEAYLSPRNAVLSRPGLRYAVSIDGAPPQVVDVIATTGADDTTMNRQWERNTSNNVNRTTTVHQVASAGVHTLTFWAVDPTVVLQKLVVDTGGGLRPSYLGPPESRRVG